MGIEILLGETLTQVNVDDVRDVITFTTSKGKIYQMYHDQDCCEHVSIDDVNGDINDLIGNPILFAEEVTNRTPIELYEDSVTWTFYKLATVKGWVDIRWYGSSNGYYSESVYFEEVN